MIVSVAVKKSIVVVIVGVRVELGVTIVEGNVLLGGGNMIGVEVPDVKGMKPLCRASSC